ncbi:aminopeptidase P family protein [Mycobacterium sp. SM1]|uniref:M24 family metallopeptidase n=1 Tax=Mycobacterium sp. SM1 TaxID=2816243 RepID=UPI001BCCB4CD|nr:M24 family metallopeptidase [Mycobacterium sp. SM1]MBS4730374.1 aminopeptidase P family protein [Mycobacterium sp. SM1]
MTSVKGPVESGNPYDENALFNYRRALVKMDENDLTAIVGATFYNSYYMSGVRTLFNEWCYSEPYEAAILPRDPAKDPTFVTLTAVLPALVDGEPTWMPNVCLYDWLSTDPTPEPVDAESKLNAAIRKFVDERVSGDLENDIVTATVKAFRRLGLTNGRVGFDDLRFGSHIKEHIPEIEVVDAHQIFWDIRKVRTRQELKLLSNSARINQIALGAVIKEMRPGVNWRDLAYLYKNTWTRHGGRSVSDKGLFWGGKFGDEYVADSFFMPNNDFELEEGKFYVLEGQGHMLQYNADASRTVFLGDPPASYLKGVDAVMHAYEAMEAALRPGLSSKGVYQAGMEAMKASGVPYPGKTIILSHGVGQEFVEWYTLFPTQRGRPESFILEEGMTIGMDCLYYGHTLGTFHFENGMMITNDGPRSFYAPPNTDDIFYRGLVITDGNVVDTYCPDVTLTQEKGIPEEFVSAVSPAPSWCNI